MEKVLNKLICYHWRKKKKKRELYDGKSHLIKKGPVHRHSNFKHVALKVNLKNSLWKNRPTIGRGHYLHLKDPQLVNVNGASTLGSIWRHWLELGHRNLTLRNCLMRNTHKAQRHRHKDVYSSENVGKTQKPSEEVNGYIWYSPTGNSIKDQNKWATAFCSNKEKHSHVTWIKEPQNMIFSVLSLS